MAYLELTAEGPQASTKLHAILTTAVQAAEAEGLGIVVARVTGEDPEEE